MDTEERHSILREESRLQPCTTDEPEFTQDEILEALLTMNPNRAPGHDHLTSDICTAVFNSKPEFITSIMNSCLNLGYFPKSWKDARVKILQKPGKDDYASLSSFRPIGLLPVFGKLLEKLFIKRLTYDAQTNGVWSAKQFGFREQTSTVNALHSLVTRIQNSRKQKLQVVGVSLDIKAAFDNAWWPALQSRLRKTNCPRNIYSLIQSYLHDRNVTLEFANTRNTKPMTKGCIQGSVCGPTFWNLILDELLELEFPSECHIQAYADDVMLLVSGNNMAEVQTKTNQALQAIHDWGVGVKLQFSPSKTQGICFTQGCKGIELLMNSERVNMHSEIKLLGVILDSNLNFIKHAKYIVTKVSKTFKNLCKFVRPTWGVSSVNVETIYRRVIEPTITYAAGVWGSAVLRTSVKDQLRKFQRSYAVRAIQAFHTVSAVSANALAQFMPLHLKVLEVHRIEQVKLKGLFDGLPEDRPMESRVRPEEKLHPASRITITPETACTQEEADSHASQTNIFTDGSKLESGDVGAAFVIYHPNGRIESRKLRMDQSCSVFQAELLALNKALLWIQKYPKTNVTIYSDNQSSLKAIQQRSNPNPFVNSIHHILHEMTPRLSVKFVWVKAHVGIEGNEAADFAAKEAAVQKRAKEYTSFPISYAKLQIRKEIQEEWNQEYIDSVQGATTRSFFPTLDSVKIFRELHENSFETTQIFTGHNFSLSYLHRFKIKSGSKCPCDSDSHQDLKHLLEMCPRYEHSRYQYFGHCDEARVQPWELQDIIENPPVYEHFVTFITGIVSTLKTFNAGVETLRSI